MRLRIATRDGEELACAVHYVYASEQMQSSKGGNWMLRITINETPETVEIILEGRLTGAWATEMRRVWAETALRINARPVSLDLRNVTFADEDGKQALREIERQTGAALIATTPWTKHLVAQICDENYKGRGGN